MSVANFEHVQNNLVEVLAKSGRSKSVVRAHYGPGKFTKVAVSS